MKDAGMLFEEESDVAGYVVVLIDPSASNDTIRKVFTDTALGQERIHNG